jgi:uncharacterized protein (DUF1015 family)
LAFQEKDE